MSDSVRDLLVRGIAAARANDIDEARFYLEWALRLDPSTEQRVEAYFWMSEITTDLEEKRDYLEEVLINQPIHYQARRSLAILDGRLDPQEIIDPNQVPQETLVNAGSIRTERYVCENCGGRLTYAPDGKSLVCDYCQAKQLLTERDSRAAEEQAELDFTLALATARGHTKPIATPAFECQACGAVYMLSPASISVTCPYCASVYVVEGTKTRKLIAPQQIIPFSVSKSNVQRRLEAWLKKHKFASRARPDPLRGIYLPVWAFTISGVIPYRYWEAEDDEPKSGSKLFTFRDILVPASNKIAEIFMSVIEDYRLEELKPYDSGYLADWPAESYQIPLSDASLKVRWIILERARADINNAISKPVRELHLNSMDLLIETFKLILVPVWMSRYYLQGQANTVLVNGQTGRIRAQKPDVQDRGIFTWLFGDE